MSDIYALKLDDVTPDRASVLRDQGIPSAATVSEAVNEVFLEAAEIFMTVANPTAIAARVDHAEFDKIFVGEGNNDDTPPLAEIYPQSVRLSLFALTLGAKISDRIERLFGENDFATATMLNSFASLAADKAVRLLESSTTPPSGMANSSVKFLTLGYSPGYCGWHLSGQKQLFAKLKPSKIDIKLSASFLMSPIKSVSGVLVEGPHHIHQFDPKFTFCRSCRTHSCTARMKSTDIWAANSI